ncbi:MAG: cation transporter [Clostridiales bacterium]|nr:cation transporter [Clostridiales bacterium]
MIMTTLFKKLFIKNYTDVSSPTVRASYGTSAGLLGIVGNAILFVIKFIGALLSGSIAVIADAINNLTDFITSIITMVGFKISGRPADKEHPYGHARYEYVTALLVACVIFFIGFETGRASIEKIFSNSVTDFSIITCIILAISIVIKIILAIIFNGLGKDIDSDAIIAMSKDSRNDAVSTSIVLGCLLITFFTELQLDGYLGLLVSIFVLISAIKLIKETIGPLIGEQPDRQLIKNITEKVKSYDGVLDIHDLIVHSYGPTQTFATVHVEVDSAIDVMISHELTDKIEQETLKELNVHLVCHLDPVNTTDPETKTLHESISNLLKANYPSTSMHDLRIVKGPNRTNVIFDVVIPFDEPYLEKEIYDGVTKTLNAIGNHYVAVIEYDKRYDTEN